MPQSIFRVRRIADRIEGGASREDLVSRLASRSPEDVALPRRIPAGNDASEEGLVRRRGFLEAQGYALEPLAGVAGRPSPEKLAGNIENLIGFAQVPIGAIGPLRINGLYANGDFFVPLATTEGALIASYHRGAYVLSQSGGARVMCLTEVVSRSPCFSFDTLTEAGTFIAWVLDQAEHFETYVARTTGHGRLEDVRVACNGTLVYLIFEYTTGDAAGQNMVTLATEEICRNLVAASPVSPRRWYVEGNLSGDKKASMLSFLGARGKKVIAEASIPQKVVRRFLGTQPEEMVEYWRISTLGGVQSGSIGVQGHYANALAGLFIACGQDVACVAECAVGITQMEAREAGLQVSVTLPNLTVGTVGGGTHLPTAAACLELLGCRGPGTARKFAEICAATVLAGEISIIAALSAGEFSQAHATYGRRRSP